MHPPRSTASSSSTAASLRRRHREAPSTASGRPDHNGVGGRDDQPSSPAVFPRHRLRLLHLLPAVGRRRRRRRRGGSDPLAPVDGQPLPRPGVHRPQQAVPAVVVDGRRDDHHLVGHTRIHQLAHGVAICIHFHSFQT